MSSLGDFHSGCTISDVFTTITSVGTPIGLAGTPAPFLVAYKEAFAESGFCTVTGLVLAINCNGMTGVNAWSVNTNQDQAFFSCGRQYQVLLRGGTVDGVCVSGYVVGRFSLNKGAALRPTIHGRNAVDVTATGAVGVDWGNVENPSTANALACTTTFSVKSVENAVTPTACSTIFSVQSVLNAVTPTACSAIFSVQSVLNAVTPTACAAIFSVQKVLDRPIIDACSTVYAVTTTVDVKPCASIFQVQKLVERPIVDACSTLFSVQRVVDADSILNVSIAQPTGVFAWPATLRGILQWLGALSSNCVRQTATLQTLRARDDLSALATADLTCEAATVHRGSFT